MQKKVYIVVLNWNGGDDTVECLKSLGSVNYDNRNIVVVDNGSEDDSVSRIKKQFPGMEIIESRTNLGFAGGNNIGIKHALKNKADYVLLLNNDTTVDKDFLQELVKIGELDKNVGALGAKICFYSNPNRIWFAGGKVNWMKNKGVHIGFEEIDTGQHDRIKEVDYLTGCCLLVKREIIEKVGFLSEDYFLYYEDLDFSLRVKRAGYKCVYVYKSKIYHKVSRSTKPGSQSYIYYHTRNGLSLVKRNGSLLNRAFLFPLCVVLFLKQIAKILLMPRKRKWALAVLKAEKDFLLGRMGRIDSD